MLRLFTAILLPVLAYSSVQCYVGQKLFSYESNNAICAHFVNYHCAAQCEWKKSCRQHTSFDAFTGRRTFVSGLLLNSKSLMVLCCASMATRVESDSTGRDKCIWRDELSISVVGPSIRTNPVLAPNHYIRDIRMERDGTSRVDVALEVCQYKTELEHCNVNNMTSSILRRYNYLLSRLERAKDASTPKPSAVQKTAVGDKNPKTNSGAVCEMAPTTDCGRDIHAQISGCCKDRQTCDRSCLKSVEQTLNMLVANKKGCTPEEVRQTLDCLGQKVNNLAQ